MLKINTLAVWTALALSLSGCGGGGGGSPATPASKIGEPASAQTCASLLVAGTPLPAKCRLTFALVQDSKGWGADIDMTSNKVQAPGIGNGIVGRVLSPPAQLYQAWADAKYGQGVVNFVGFDWSIPGATIPSTLNGTPPSVMPLATQLAMAPIHIDGVITNLLTNDELVNHEDVPTYVANVNQLISTIVGYGATPIFAEPSPTCQPGTDLTDPNYGINALAYNAVVTFASRGYPALGNLNAWESNTSRPNGLPWNKEWMSSDCVHENQAGYLEDVNNYVNGAPNAMGNTNSLEEIIDGKLASIST